VSALDWYCYLAVIGAPGLAAALIFLAAVVTVQQTRLDATNAEVRRLRERKPVELARGCADLGQCSRLLTGDRYRQQRSGSRG
jgi:hypothetical protein